MGAPRVSMSVPRALSLAFLFAYLLFLLDLTWLEFPSRNPATNLVPLRSMIADWKGGGRELLVNFAGNIAAFLPIGLIPSAIRPGSARLRHAALFSLALSAVIEGVQYEGGRRVADVDDILLNTAGGTLGYVLIWPPIARLGARSEACEEGSAGGLAGTPGESP